VKVYNVRSGERIVRLLYDAEKKRAKEEKEKGSNMNGSLF